MEDPDRVFVYGTLRRGAGHPLALRLAEEGDHLGEASWRGRLYSLGPYPAAVRQAGHFRVRGDLFRLTPNGDLLTALDEYEGLDEAHADGYVREAAEVLLDDGHPERCWLYRYTGPVAPDAWIPSGDWLGHLAAGAPAHRRTVRRVPK